MLLLVSFPIILLGMTWVFLATINYFSTGYYDQAGYFVNQLDADSVNWTFTQVAPFIVGGVAIWFAIAYFSNTKMIQHATGAQPLMRRENPRVYNIV
jgi:heat shock protein HtpX